MKHKHAEVLIKTPHYNEYDRLHFLCGVKHSVLKSVHKLNSNTKLILQEFKENVRELVRVRNKLLRVQWRFKNGDNPFDYGLTPENIVNLMEYTKKFTSNKEYNTYSVYDIPLRKKSKFGEDIKEEADLEELTDSDIDTDMLFED